MKRKGFTLIELLAVIVVLAVIALITTPTILGVIEKSRKSSYKASMYGIINAADIYLAQNLGKISKNEEIVFTCDGVKCSNSEGDKLSFKGEVPKSGSIYIKGNGTVTVESVYNGRYYANTIDDDIEITEEDTSLTRAELTQLVKSLQQKVNQLEQQVQQSNQNTSNITNLKNQHESDITSIWNKVGKEDLSSIGNGSISKILISQNELISNLNNIITSNQNSVSNLTNQLNTINTKLDSKANASHTHDDRYYTESEINTKLNSKANTSHTHDDRYYTESETNNLLGKYFQGSIIVRMSSSTLALTTMKTTYTVPLNNATWNYGAANTLSVGSDGTITIKKPGYYYISGAVQLTAGSDNANVIAKVILMNGSPLIQMTLRKNGTASESVALPGVLVHIGEANTVRLQVTDYSGTSTTIGQPTFLNVTCVKLD